MVRIIDPARVGALQLLLDLTHLCSHPVVAAMFVFSVGGTIVDVNVDWLANAGTVLDTDWGWSAGEVELLQVLRHIVTGRRLEVDLSALDAGTAGAVIYALARRWDVPVGSGARRVRAEG